MSAISQRNKESAKIEALLENLIQKSGDLTDDQSLAHLFFHFSIPRTTPEFRALLKLLIRRGLLDTKTRGRVGISIGETSERMQTSVQAECTILFQNYWVFLLTRYKKTPPYNFYSEGRIDRQQFEKLIKRKSRLLLGTMGWCPLRVLHWKT